MIIASTVPPLINVNFRQHLSLENSDSFSSWSVWCIPSARIREGRSGAVLAGWQFLADGVARGVALEQATGAGSGIQQMRGVLPIKVHEAENLIRALPPGKDPRETYELRSLRLPAHYVEALWLYSLCGTADWVVPYVSLRKELQEMQPYRLSFLLTTIANTARHENPEL